MVLHGLYRAVMQLGGPAIEQVLARRAARGKEDPQRIGERRGVTERARPHGPLIWCHAASVGESLSVLPLLARLANHAAVLVTTGTVTSAGLLARRLPAGAMHQFIPIDRPSWVRAFYDHWRPDLALWVESELWPTMASELRLRCIPAALVNGRMSARSFARWRRVPATARSLLAAFDVVLAQTAADADRLAALGAGSVKHVGNLKYAAAALPDDPTGRSAFEVAVDGRPRWLIASSHPGEEDIAAAAHEALRQRVAGLLTIIVPRHPERGPSIEAVLRTRGLAVTRRSAGALPAPADEIYIADTMGELGLFYRSSTVAVLGGSFIAHGGHNPIEPAQLGSAVLYGPHMQNFAEIAAELEQAGGARRVPDRDVLQEDLLVLLTDENARQRLAQAARSVADRHADVIDKVMAELTPLIARAGIVA